MSNLFQNTSSQQFVDFDASKSKPNPINSQENKIGLLTQGQISQIQQFRNSLDTIRFQCLTSMLEKKNSFPQLKQQMFCNLQTQKQNLVNELSKVLVKMEDIILQELRNKLKTIFQLEQTEIQQNYLITKEQLTHQLSLYEDKINGIIQILSNNEGKSKKWQGKIAEGIIDQEYKEFTEKGKNYPIPHATFLIREEQLKDIMHEVEDLLQKETVTWKSTLINYSTNKWEKNHEYSKIKENSQKEKQSEEKQQVESYEQESMQKKEEKSRDKYQVRGVKSGLDDYRQLQSQLKRIKLEQIGQHRQQQTSITKLTRLALEKKKLLEQLK